MIGFVITLLLAITFLAALAVLAPSLRQAWQAYGELKQALALCSNDRIVIVRMTGESRRAPQPRRHARVSMRPMPSVRTAAMRAAA